MLIKYMTKIETSDRDWIHKTAKELDVSHPRIIQIALKRLRDEKWDTIKTIFEAEKAEHRLKELRAEEERIKREKAELTQKVNKKSV